MSTPDVTVVVAVYNTMPYLTECLRSVVEQTIGRDRLELIAVDDGSTDTSGAELDRWAAEYPNTIRVLHQANSGGPANPSNRALEIATGRYVFFLGSDDYLGREALRRLVTTADELDADIVLGRLVGAGGRVVNQAVFTPGDRDDINLVNSALPWALSNTKLFRRSMLEEHGIRYPEELRSGSDQPFTMRAVVAARRIAVRADYRFYYAVRRTDSSNITYGTPLNRFVQDAAVIMDTAADVITDQAARTRVLSRHFTWELAKLLGPRFLHADPAEQRRVQEGIRKLAETYLTEEMRAALDVRRRTAISVAQFGTLDDLTALIEHQDTHGLSPVVDEDGRAFVAFPGFRDPAKGFPDAWFDGTATIRRPNHQAGPAEVSWGYDDRGRRSLRIGWQSSVSGLGHPDEPLPRVLAGERPAARVSVTGDRVLADLALDDLVTGARRRHKRKVKFVWTLRGDFQSRPVTASDVSATRRILHRRGLRFYSVGTFIDDESRLGVVINPVTPGRVAGRLARAARIKR